MMSVSTLLIGFDVVSCVLICLVTLSTVIGLVDFSFLLSILCVLLILSRLIRASISVFFVPCCPVLLSFYFSYLTCLNLINGDGDMDPHLTVSSGHPSPHPNSVSISSAIFARLTIVTDHATPSVSIGLIYVVLRCRLIIIQYLCLYSKFLRQRCCIQFHVRQRVPSWWMETNFQQYSIWTAEAWIVRKTIYPCRLHSVPP